MLVQIYTASVHFAFQPFPLLGFIWNTETVAHPIGVVSSVVPSYFAHKHFSFRKPWVLHPRPVSLEHSDGDESRAVLCGGTARICLSEQQKLL